MDDPKESTKELQQSLSKLSIYCILIFFRSTHHKCSIKRAVLKNFAKFIGKHLSHSLFFNKIAGPRSATLLKKRLWQRCFTLNFAKFLETSFLQRTSGQLLLTFYHQSNEYERPSFFSSTQGIVFVYIACVKCFLISGSMKAVCNFRLFWVWLLKLKQNSKTQQ